MTTFTRKDGGVTGTPITPQDTSSLQKALGGWKASTAQFDSTAHGNGGYVVVPHGLAAAPSLAKIIAFLVPVTMLTSTMPGVLVAAVDATNITFQVGMTVVQSGTYNVNVLASL